MLSSDEPVLARGEIHVWTVDLAQPAGIVAAMGELLGDAERVRAGSLSRTRERFTVAHGALREVLGAYAGILPAELSFDEPELGKPALASAPLEFSLAHSYDVALVAVAAGRPVGVDVERVRDDLDHERLARRAFTEDEAARLGATAYERERRLCFFRLWTCKEACLKESGAGIVELRSVETAAAPGGGLSARDAAGPWAVAELEPAPGYVGAVAARGGRLELELRTWRPGLSGRSPRSA